MKVSLLKCLLKINNNKIMLDMFLIKMFKDQNLLDFKTLKVKINQMIIKEDLVLKEINNKFLCLIMNKKITKNLVNLQIKI